MSYIGTSGSAVAAARTVVVGGVEHAVVAGRLVPGTVVRLACGARYVVSAGRKSAPVRGCCAARAEP